MTFHTVVATFTLLRFHQEWSWVVVGANVIAGVWALSAHRATSLRSRNLWWFVLFAEATIVVQVLAGSALIVFQDLTAPDFHAFYGFATLISVVVIYAYRAQLIAKKYLLYGVGGLFLAGMAIRAMVVG